MQGSAVPSEADGSCISENNDEISPKILYRNEKENKPDCGLVRNITGTAETMGVESNYMNGTGAFSLSASTRKIGNSGHTSNVTGVIFSFSASGSITTSSENRPINISAIPLIVAI